MRHQIAVILLIPLVISTSSVLMLFRQALEPVDTIGAPSPGIGVVRAYISDLNAFLGGGTADAVMKNYEAHASVRIKDGSDAIGRDALETSLLAVRSSYPELTVSLEGTRNEGDVVVAELAVNLAEPRTPEWMALSAVEPSTALVDSFRIERGLIVEHRSSLLGMAAVHLHDAPPAEMRLMLSSRLTVARLTLPALQTTYVPAPGPAMLLVRDGTIEVAGGPADYVALSPSQPWQALSIGVPVHAGSGALIVSTVAGIAVRNTAAEPARIDVAALPTTNLDVQAGPQDMQRVEQAAEALPLETRMASALLSMLGVLTTVEDVSVTPIARSEDRSEIGSGTLQVAFVSLPPGMSVRLDDSHGAVAYMPVQAPSSDYLEESFQMSERIIHNTGSGPVTLLVARYAA